MTTTSTRLLGVIAARARSGRTVARFQVQVLDGARARGHGVDDACAAVVAAHAEAFEGAAPVHTWT